MLILGIESSCDETGVALYDTDKGLIADALHTQIEMHRLYGGVVPELASRDHIRRIIPLLNEVMNKAGKTPQDLDAVAVTEGPGLAGALLVGNSVAYGIGLALDIPVVGIHHLEGHLLSSLLADDKPSFPFVALLVSGGHTQIMEVRALGDYELLEKHWMMLQARPSIKRLRRLVIPTRAALLFPHWQRKAHPALLSFRDL